MKCPKEFDFDAARGFGFIECPFCGLMISVGMYQFGDKILHPNAKGTGKNPFKNYLSFKEKVTDGKHKDNA